MSLLRSIAVLFLHAVVFVSSSPAAFDTNDLNKGDRPLKILHISPSGNDVPTTRQIVFQFNRPVVPVGRMQRRPDEIPITIEPPADCEWRWLNTSSLACQLSAKSALSPATRYQIEVRPGIGTQDGITLSETLNYSFVTQRPRVGHYPRFHTWRAPGLPRIIVQFDQDAYRESVAEHLFMRLENGERIPLLIEEDPEVAAARERLRDDSANSGEQDREVVGMVAEGRQRLALSGQLPGDQEKLSYARRSWLVYPEAELPLDTRVELRVEPGILSAVGPEPGTEQRVVVSFDTFPEFRFLGVRCSTNAGKRGIIAPGDDPANRRCNPLGWTELLFSAPLSKQSVQNNLLVKPDLAGGRSDYDPWANVYVYAGLSRPHLRDEPYPVALPQGLRAYESYALAAQAGAVRDLFGRPLVDDIDMVLTTDHRRPQFYLRHQLSVLEKAVQTHLPAVVTNLESAHLDYQTLTSEGMTRHLTSDLKIPRVEDVGFRYPIKVRELLEGRSGAVQARWRTEPPVPDRDHQRPHWFFSQVTPFHVHVKVGHYDSLLWVTRLDTGQPVQGAEVGVYVDRFGEFSKAQDFIAHAITNAEGIATLPGTLELDPQLKYLRTSRRNDPQLFVHVQKDQDMALLPLNRGFAINVQGPNRSYLPADLEPRHGHIHSWGFTAQGVYKAGDTVQFKLYVRDQDAQRFVAPPREGYRLEVYDPTNKVVHVVKDLSLSEFGAYYGKFTVPETGTVGWYRFELSASFIDRKWEPLRVLISDFTPAPFRVNSDLNGALFRADDTLKVSTQARLHSGGPYVNAQSRITVRAQGRPLRPSEPLAKGFTFDVHLPGPPTQTVHQSEAQINDRGELETEFKLPEIKVLYGRLMVESAVRDDRGKYVAGTVYARYAGRDRYVGVRQPDWLLKSGKAAEVQTLVVNEAGKLMPGAKVKITVQYRETKAARIKGAGNAYLTQYVHEWKPVAECSQVSQHEIRSCEFTPRKGGLYRITVAIEDTLGRTHQSTLQRWAQGPGQVLFETRPGHTLQMVPEKEQYRVGETARLMVQNPFPGARALVSVERFGVQRHWTTILKTSTEVIEIPVEADSLPGFYVSVLVMSPRVQKPLGDGQVDLGKPAFRIGYARIAVKDAAKEIQVKVTPREPVYKPRSEVTVDLQATIPEGATAPLEFAVAVLDEAVFDLIGTGKTYYDPYQGFYRLDALDLHNFNLLKRLIGIQKFEKKGANPGGDGGGDLMLRSLFKFVSYWNPSIRPDAEGKATIRFQVPDNLTGWRVLALAVTPDDRMGLGDGGFKVNQQTEIRPALPNQVTEGDRFEARFTVMNRTDARRTLKVRIDAEGALRSGPAEKRLQLTIGPYQRHGFGIPLEAGASGEIVFTVHAQDTRDEDLITLPLGVRRLQALEATATYGTSISNEISESILFPKHIRTDMGHVSIVVSPSVVGSLESAFEYLRDYPYTCWEQVLTKGVMAAHYLNLKAYIPDSFAWPKAMGLPESTLKAATNYQAPNGGMVYYKPLDRYVDPYLSAYTAIAINWLRNSGYPIPKPVEDKLHDYLLNMLRHDVFPTFYTEGMSSTVRAVTLAALATQGKIERSDLLRYKPHLKRMSLFGKAHYLMALTHVTGTEALKKQVIDMIRSHANEAGGKVVFVEALDFAYQRILDSSLRTQCAVLSALLEHQDPDTGGASASDIPFKLMQTITQGRKQSDRWQNTQENMFCINAITGFGRVYEKEKPDMTLRVFLDGETIGQAIFKDHRDLAQELERPIRPGDPGRPATVRLQRDGSGRYYYAARLFYSPEKLKENPVNAGIEVRREYSVQRNGQWQLLKNPMRIQTGELVHVDLYVSLPAARNFVVVDDPVPGGLEPVNRDLATASLVDADEGNFKAAGGSFWYHHSDWREYGVSFWSFYHQELRHHAARFYSEYLSAGNYHLSYTAQAIAPGEFTVMPVHAEEMYNPDTFGQGVPANLKVIAPQ